MLVVWTGKNQIWGWDEKIPPHQISDVPWELFQKRPGLTKKLIPLACLSINDDLREEYITVLCDKYTQKELYALARARNLPQAGSKEDIAGRLLNHGS